jgi:hypothetical protein
MTRHYVFADALRNGSIWQTACGQWVHARVSMVPLERVTCEDCQRVVAERDAHLDEFLGELKESYGR